MPLTPKILFRRGILQSPLMENARWYPMPPAYIIDIQVTLDVSNGLLIALAGSGGVSTVEIARPVTGKQRNWSIGSGVFVPDELVITESPPRSGHWLWEPAADMPFFTYRNALYAVNSLFV